MNLESMTIILLAAMVIFLLMGAEVFVGVGLAAAIGLVFFMGKSIDQFAATAFVTLNSFSLTALPLFVFMGAVFSSTGVVNRLFTGANKLVGGLPGGIISSVIVANAVFGAICASTVAATATFGKIAYPEMERLGYNPKLALGSLAVGGILSAAIPPSLTLIVYGTWASVSVAQLFAAVLIPGIVLTVFFIITVMVMLKINPVLAPKSIRSSWKERLDAIKDLLPWLALIGIVLGVIFGGIMTPTESASMGAFLSVVLALIYRQMSFKAFQESMRSTVKVTTMVAFLMFASWVLGQVFDYIGLTKLFASLILGLPFGKFGIIAVIAIMYIALGCFIDDWSMLLITLPFVLPTITSLGFSPIWFGVWFVLVGETGLITPPYGLNLFVLKGVIPKHDIMEIAAGAAPFLIPMLGTAALITAFPIIAMWLPGTLY